MPPLPIAICWVNISSDLRKTACDRDPGPDFKNCTLFMSSATCPSCRAIIDSALDALIQDATVRPAPAQPLPS